MQPFDPAATARTVVALHAPGLAATGRGIHIEQRSADVRLIGDEVRVRQVLSNLIGNAAKHGQGEIAVTMDSAPVGDQLEVSVVISDRGPGLSPEMAARAFEPFERGGSSGREGLGLGLPLARALALRMGGDLSFQSSAGRGGGFRFTFVGDPAESHLATSGDAAGAAIGQDPPPGLRVLVAEDSPLSLSIIAAILRARGCSVAEAASGPEALAIFERQTFDLVVLDLRMPGLDGLDVARRMAHQRSERTLPPMVLATATPTAEIQAAALAFGVKAVVAKPIGWAEIGAILGLAPAALDPTAGEPWLIELQRALGDDADTIIGAAPDAILACLSQLKTADRDRDQDAVRYWAHRLAGLAATLGLGGLKQAAQLLEAAPPAADDTAARLQTLERAAATAMRTLGALGSVSPNAPVRNE